MLDDTDYLMDMHDRLSRPMILCKHCHMVLTTGNPHDVQSVVCDKCRDDQNKKRR